MVNSKNQNVHTWNMYFFKYFFFIFSQPRPTQQLADYSMVYCYTHVTDHKNKEIVQRISRAIPRDMSKCSTGKQWQCLVFQISQNL